MAPEVWVRDNYSLKADVWSLGCTIYELVQFFPPFMAKDEKALMNKIIGEDP